MAMQLPGRPIRRMREAISGEGLGGAGVAEGLVTGLGASWLMGPVGLLLGVGQGLLSRRMHKSELDAAAEHTALMDDLGSDLLQQLEQAGALSEAPEHEQLFASERANIERALEFAQSSNPEMQKHGLEELLGVRERLNAFTGESLAFRNERRKEIEGRVQNEMLAPLREDMFNASSIEQQIGDLTRQAGANAQAPNWLKTQVLNYSGSTLAQSADGRWRFNVLGLGFDPGNMPDMTLAQAKQILVSARKGRHDYMNSVIENYRSEAEADGYSVNLEDGTASVYDVNIPRFLELEPQGNERGITPTTDPNAENSAGVPVVDFGQGVLRNLLGDEVVDGAVGGVTDAFESGARALEEVKGYFEFTGITMDAEINPDGTLTNPDGTTINPPTWVRNRLRELRQRRRERGEE